MPKSNNPYDPQPEREDALGELAHKGYQAVPGDHAARLKSMHDRLGLPGEAVSAPEAVVRPLRPRRWLAIAAGVAALVVAGIVFVTYDSPTQQIASVVESEEQTALSQEALESMSGVAENELDAENTDQISFNDVEAPTEAKMQAPAVPATKPEVEGEAVAESAAPEPRFESGRSGLRSSPESTYAEPQSQPGPQAGNGQPPVAEGESMANAPAPAARKMKRSAPPSTAADMVAEEVAEQGMDADDAAASSFRMERAPIVKTREIKGEVLEPSGVPVIGAVLTIEETGQQVVSDQQGEFTIMIGEDAVVGNLTAQGYNTLMFDLTKGEEYRLYMPRVSSSLPRAQLQGKEIALRLIAPKAVPYPTFDAYLAEKRSSFSGEKVTVQFEVNRFGRPRQIVTGPGAQNRDAIKVLKDWLKNGPDWPEEYQRKSWRYSVVMP